MPFVCLSIGGVRSFVACAQSVWGKFEFFCGFVCRQGERTENVVNVISDSMRIPDNELLGCLIIGTHCSIPTIRKTLAGYPQPLRFVLFYSTSDGTLVSIPMLDGQILLDEQYYGEEKLEELKIWTRRRR